MKLIEIPDIIHIMGPDDCGVIELSSDLGAEHIRKELERLAKENPRHTRDHDREHAKEFGRLLGGVEKTERVDTAQRSRDIGTIGYLKRILGKEE